MIGLFSKSSTMGAELTGHIVGSIIGFPGSIIDAAINDFISDANSSFMYNILYATGWCSGALIGGILGLGVASIAVIPDSLMRLLSFVYLTVSDFINTIATKIRLFDGGEQNSNFIKKAWSIGKLALGVPIGSLFSLIGHIADFTTRIFGFTIAANQFTYKVGFVAAGFVGGCTAVVFSLPFKLIDQIGRIIANAYYGFRDSIRHMYAFGYAKLAIEPVRVEAELGIGMHAAGFFTAVEKYKYESTGTILKKLIYPQAANAAVAAENNLANAAESDAAPSGAIICPITKEAVIKPIVDINGHIYEKNALLQWREIENIKTSPLTRTSITDNQLFTKSKLRLFHEQRVQGKTIPAEVAQLLDRDDVKQVFQLG